MSKRRMLAITFLLLLLVFVYRVFAVYTVRSGECKPHPGGPYFPFPPRIAHRTKPLVVVTYNIAGHDELLDSGHVRKLADAINQLQPDIVGLQEVHRATWQARGHDQLKELANLTGMHGFFALSYEQHGGAFGNAILTRGELVSEVVHKLPSVGEPRTLLEALVRFDGQPINVYVTHLTTWGSINKRNRAEQLHCLAEHVRTSQYPYLLLGDFNNTLESSEVRTFLHENGSQLCGVNIGNTFHSILGHRRIDYIFADKGWAWTNPRVPHIGPSDHWPVVVDLWWNREDAAEQTH